MRKVIFLAILAGGGYLVYRLDDVYWTLAVMGICISFAILSRKLFAGEAARMLGVALSAAAVMLGGGSIVARWWGEVAAGAFVVACIILLLVSLKRIKRMFPTLVIAEEFEKILHEKSESKSDS